MSQSRQPSRLVALDALRGIAALSVVLYHIPTFLRDAAHWPLWLHTIFAHGALGVDAFFVLSGFVIALSTARGPWTARFLGRFVVRRSIRLDPPYWLAIALELGLGWVGVRWLGAKSYPIPSGPAVLAHLTYTQGLLGFSQISDVFWTLCFEIQYYLAYVGALVILHSQTVASRLSISRSAPALLSLIIVWSLLVRSGTISQPIDGLALVRAYEFGVGVLAFCLARSLVPPWLGTSAILAVLAVRVVSGGAAEAGVMALAAMVCVGSASSSRLNDWMGAAPLQFLGRTSYSLYLYHGSLVGRITAVAALLFPAVGQTPGASVAACLIIVGACLIGAWILHRLVEVPAHAFSRRVSL